MCPIHASTPRPGEVAALRVADITLSDRSGMVRIRHGKGLKSDRSSATAIWRRRSDECGARGAQRAATREPPAPAGARNPIKGGSLVRSGDQRHPSAGFRFVSDHQAT